MSKKTKIILSIIGSLLGVVLLIIVFITYSWNNNTSPCIPDIPERIGEVPNTAKWIGGCDGGHWFNIDEVKPNQNKYEITIYFDYNGKLYEKGFFKSECQIRYNTSEELLEKILYYEGEIRMKDDCDLIPFINN